MQAWTNPLRSAPSRRLLAGAALALLAAGPGLAPAPVVAAAGGLRLTGRALVAVPQANHAVFLSWRLLQQDGAAAFDVYRSSRPDGGFAKIGSARETTTFRDAPGKGTFWYRVVPTGGSLAGKPSNTARVTTELVGRDWVEILPAARGRKLQFSDRHFADTDGDGELEFLTYRPQVPSYRGGRSPESYKLEVYELLEDAPPRWTFDTGMGTQTNPSSGDKRTDWDYEWTFKPVAWDLDGDAKAEIVTLAKRGGKYEYVVLADGGESCRVLAAMPSPIPVADLKNNSRHFPFFADLGGRNCSFLLQGGTYRYWEMWAYDWNGAGFDLRWHVKSTAPGFRGNRSSSHTVLVADLDGDGRDEISNGVTVLDDDGSVLWTGNAQFGGDNHVDGQVIDDIHPGSPGLELMMHTEWGRKYALYAARTGKLLWQKDAPGRHLQLNIAANVMPGPGLDVLGVTGGHRASGVFACRHDGSDFAYPYADRPHNGDRWWAMDWDGAIGRNVCLNFTTVYGLGGNVLYEVDLRDAPAGKVIPWNTNELYHFWCNVDIVGDYREDILVQTPDGRIRAYVNTQPPPVRRRCKWQSHAYQMMQAPGDYRYFIRALDEPPTKLPADRMPLVYAGRNQTIGLAQAAKLDATVHDGVRLHPEQGCRVAWSKLLGPGEVTFEKPGAVDTTARFARTGTYVLRLTVSDGRRHVSDDVAVVVRDKPPALAKPARRRPEPAAAGLGRRGSPPALVEAGKLRDLKVTSGKAYEWFALEPNTLMYTDRQYVFRSIPKALAAAAALRTANEDRISPANAEFVSFDVSEDVTVYVLYTTVNTKLTGAWLNEEHGWKLAGFTVPTTVRGEEATRRVRCKSFPAGSRVRLGGNGSTQRLSSMYNVVVVPRKATAATR